MDRHGPWYCPVCYGRSCLGGGKRDCVQRDPKPSHIAGILDSYGGTRVVVAHKSTLKNHVRQGEFLCIVPNMLVHEPIWWHDVPSVVRLGEMAVERFVQANEWTNDPDKQEAIRAYRSRKTWHKQRSLDTSKIVFT